MQSFIKNLGIPAACLLLMLTTNSCDKGTTEADLPTISIEDLSFDEGDTQNEVLLTVTLSEVSAANVVVNFSTKDVSAGAGADYLAQANSQLIINAGDTEGKLAIQILGDNIFEQNESFEVILLNPLNAVIADGKAVLTIRNDENANGIIIPTTGYSTPETYAGMNLVWQDEFNGTELDLSSWTQEIGNNNGWGNQELMYYRPENTSMVEGNLVITAKSESYGGQDYTSSRMITKDKKEFQYGRIDIRAVLPTGQGIWPALWMLGSNLTSVGWPACGETDIMELVGNQPNRIHGTVHYGNQVTGHLQNGSSKALSGTAIFNDEYHVFSIIWKQDEIQWLLDDVVFHTITPATTAPAPYPFNQPSFFIFNVAVGGQWPGSPNATTNFPQHMIVDYVRVFQE
jgi:Glycosyl hydrolases family 16/Calx-beta domain